MTNCWPSPLESETVNSIAEVATPVSDGADLAGGVMYSPLMS